MSATNATTNYNFPLFIGTDKPAWLVDWNSAMSAIDAAIKGVDTDVQGAIVDISGLSSTVAAHTSSISTISGQITVITTNLNTATGNINTINSLIGNGTPTTTDQTIIGAINELHANQGDLDDLTTPAASLVAAINAITGGGGAVSALAVSFDPTGTSLVSVNVQAAIVELLGKIPANAAAVSYDNTASGLQATTVQGALDELAQGGAGGADFGTGVDISSYTSFTNLFIAPADGYVSVYGGNTGSSAVGFTVYGANATSENDASVGAYVTSGYKDSLYVRKGAKIRANVGNDGSSFSFVPLQ